MGIRLLENLLISTNRNDLKCYRAIRIPDLVRAFGRHVIVVDMKSCFYWILGNENCLYGGQTKRFARTLETFIVNFVAIGVKLVAFKESIIQPGEEESYVARKSQSWIEISQFFLDTSVTPKFHVLPPNYEDVAMSVFAKHNIKIYQNIDECDYEVAKYARDNKCLAILAQDTDFMFYNIAQPYISMKHLKLKDMSTFMYDKEEFARTLRLDFLDLPWIKIIMEIVEPELRSKLDKWKFHKVASFIKLAQKEDRLTPAAIVDHFKVEKSRRKQINQQVINENFSYWSLKKTEKKTLETFSDENWNMILEKIKHLYINDSYMGLIYSAVVMGTYYPGRMLEDLRENLLPCQLLKKLRQKIYGILLLEKPTDRVVNEYLLSRNDTFRGPTKVVPIFPKSKHSGLLAYWSGDSKFDDEKLNLFTEAVNMEITMLDTLDPHLIIPNEGLTLSDLELNALIASIVLPKYMTVDELIALPDVDLKPRAITIYTAITKAFLTVSWLNNTLGFPVDKESASTINYQEGKMFHFQWNEAILKKCTYPTENLKISLLEKAKAERSITKIKEILRPSTN